MNNLKTACAEGCDHIAPSQLGLQRATITPMAESRTSVALSMFVAVIGALWMGHACLTACSISLSNLAQDETRYLAAASWFISGALVCGAGVLIAMLLSGVGRFRVVVTLGACALVCTSLVGVLLSSVLLVSPHSLEVQAGATGLLAAAFLGCCGFAALVFRFRRVRS